MRFLFPLLPAEFEIPDDWWAAAGMHGFTASGAAFRSTAGAELVPLHEIEPPFRFPEYPKDWRGFDRQRMIDVLTAIAGGVPLRPASDFASVA
jgi:hypothetical protein